MSPFRIMMAAAVAVPLVAGVAGTSAPARAETQGVVAVANDQPITERDITQRITLLKIVGDLPPGGLTRKQALKQLIDDQVKLLEARRLMMVPSDAEISERIDRVAKGMKYTRQQLLKLLKDQGISEASLRSYLTASTAFSRLIAAKYREEITVNPSDVDARMAKIKSDVDTQMSKIMNDPRMKPITVYSLMEITLPLEGDDPMLLQSRAIEAQQFRQKFKGCGSAKAAAEGIFNVKVGKKFDADAAKLPKQMKEALDKAGEGRAVGPMRGKAGIQLVALCGTRRITPPKPDFKMPTREQVERLVINEKYDKLEENYLKTAREKVYVEYRDSEYAQQ
ncbi:SurA N-terminal domain-containing protein [Aestuariivirga sp.]|uniref:SurA N-terminal domain-containing protein n=1 Tax=Aestuariivirga sp. TaxID=2650926 RepID=UPI00391BE7D6